MTQKDNANKKLITLAEGAGGKSMNRLISKLILKGISKKNVTGGLGLDALDDGAVIPIKGKKLVITTDGHTIFPIFFRGGDIGKISVCGTLNDLAVMGAKPIAITSSIILEEGFPSEDLKKIIASANRILKENDVALVAGDTKVMEHGSLDKIVISTTGIGFADKIIKDSGAKPGDKIIVSGTIGDHGFSLLSEREGINFGTTLKSDCACVWPLVKKALKIGGVHAMKDPTRGGLAAVLNEFAQKSKIGLLIDEEEIPIRKEVSAASEMLGIDPLVVANEGKVVFSVSKNKAERILNALKKHPLGKNAKIIGEVITGKKNKGKVIIRTVIGGSRILDMPVGDPLPRVC